MDKREIKGALLQALKEISNLRGLPFGNQEFSKWLNKVSHLLELAYGKGSSQYYRFVNAPGKGLIVQTEQVQQKDYSFRLNRYESVLESILRIKKPTMQFC